MVKRDEASSCDCWGRDQKKAKKYQQEKQNGTGQLVPAKTPNSTDVKTGETHAIVVDRDSLPKLFFAAAAAKAGLAKPASWG